MSVRDNLLFPLARLARLDRHRRVNETMERLNLQEAAPQRPHAVSGVDNMRATVARALIGEPKLLLADEPAGGLDLALRAEWHKLLRMVRDESSVPVLLASRDLDTCFELANNMFLLNAGRILQVGPPRSVLDQPVSVEAARLLGIRNLFPAEIVALDPGRNTAGSSSRISSWPVPICPAACAAIGSGCAWNRANCARPRRMAPSRPQTRCPPAWNAPARCRAPCAWNLPAALWPKSPAMNSSRGRIIKTGWWSFRRKPCGCLDAPEILRRIRGAGRRGARPYLRRTNLGLRMALYGLKLLELDDPLGRHRKRLVTFIEIDRCATDAIPVVTGCRLGKRALKFRDFGKVAATFCDLEADRAVRVVALGALQTARPRNVSGDRRQKRATDARLSRTARRGPVLR